MFKRFRIKSYGVRYSKELQAITLLAVFVIILFLPVMLGWRGIFHDDQAAEEFPRYHFVANNLQRGIIPLWDPYTWCGAIPFYARYYADTYYLPLWPFYFLTNLNNLDHAYWALIVIPRLLHYLFAALGMFFFLRRVIKCGCISSCFGALAYVYSPAFTYSYVWQQVISVQAWLPWFFTVYVSAVERFKLWKIALGGLVFAFILTAANPGIWHLVVFLWGSIILLLTIIQFRKRNSIFMPLIIALLIGVLGAGLSGVYLSSFFDGMQHTEEHIELTSGTALREPYSSLPLSYLVTLFVPNFFGSITGVNFITEPLIFWEANMTGGMAVSLLVMLGLVLIFSIPATGPQAQRQRWYVFVATGLYLFAILCALGRYTPFYRYVIGYLPWVGQLPRPIRYRMLQCFAAAILSAVGLEHLTTALSNQKRARLRFWVWFYLGFSLLAVGATLMWPQINKNKGSYLGDFWYPEDYFLEGQAVGVYSPKTAVVKKIGMMFDGSSSGEIRYADNHDVLPTGGMLASNYYAPTKGWYEFNVNIPPNKFLWIYPKKGTGEIAYSKIAGIPCFSYYDGKWIMHTNRRTINFYPEIKKSKSSLFSKLIKGEITRPPLIISILYWMLISIAILAGINYLSIRRFGYFLALIASVEFLVFAILAFYGCTFSWQIPSPHRIRSLRPLGYSMLHRILGPLTTVVNNPMLRVATDQPFHDNFCRLNGYFALMGYEMHPLEKRFKHAIETAYGQPMDWPVYDNEPLPGSSSFLSHFSVGYLMTTIPIGKFPLSVSVPLPGEPGFFVHINPSALPRVFTMDRLVAASEEKQLFQLVSGNLRKAVYVGFDSGIKPSETMVKNVSDLYFDLLQKMNPVKRVNMYNPNRIDIEIEINVPAMCVLTEIWYPGWEAAVDNQPVKIYRVNYCQRGVWLEKGKHNVVFRFRPRAWQLGVIISIGTAIFILILVVIGQYRDRKIRYKPKINF